MKGNTIRVSNEVASMIDDVIDYWFAGDTENRTSYFSLRFEHSGPEFFDVKDLREAFSSQEHPWVADQFSYNRLRDKFFMIPKDSSVIFEIVNDEDSDI